MESAPLFAEIADGPDGGEAWWLTADDGVRIRVGAWAKDAPKGTVLLFPGRTEYIEKYGRTAAHLARRGYATRWLPGQGLPQGLRITIGTREQMDDVATALREMAEASA